VTTNWARRIGILLGSSQLQSESSSAPGGLNERLVQTERELSEYLQHGMGVAAEDMVSLFDSERWPSEQLDDLAGWLRGRVQLSAKPVSIIVVFVGHGFPLPGGSAKLAVRKSRADGANDALLDPNLLSGTLVANLPPGSRYYMYLDCCYAREIGEAMSFKPINVSPNPTALYAQDGAPAADQFAIGPLVDGALFLAACDHDLKAFAPPGSPFTRMTTMFLGGLEGKAAAPLTFTQAYQRMLDYMDAKERSGEWDRSRTPRPMLVPHKTEKVPLTDVPLLKAGWRGPLDEFDFDFSDDLLSIVVVCRESGSDSLVSAVAETLIEYGEEIEKATGKQTRAADGREVKIVALNVRDAFNSEAAFKKRLAAVCQADLVFFDATADDIVGIEPGVMILMGVRSVARRGVSICSVNVAASQLFSFKLPYNLQYLNIASHASETGIDRSHRISRKIERGFQDYRESPDYLDLPSYDAIRELGVSAESYKPLAYSYGPLYLGPFQPEVIKECFEPLERALRARLRPLVDKNRTGRDRPDVVKIKRLMDDTATKLVGLTLYESIRRHDFCLVDWTLLRPNVMFEFGVRLASAPKGAVHIVADLGVNAGGVTSGSRESRVFWPKLADSPDSSSLRHVKDLYILFSPIVYQPKDEQNLRDMAVIAMIDRFRAGSEFFADDDQYYTTIAEAVPAPSASALHDAIDLIDQRAKYFYIHGEDTLQVTALHAEHNPALANAAMARALALHLAETFLRVAGGETEAVRLRLAQIENLLIRELGSRVGTQSDVASLRRGLEMLKQMSQR
jgi:hypothetical protein